MHRMVDGMMRATAHYLRDFSARSRQPWAPPYLGNYVKEPRILGYVALPACSNGDVSPPPHFGIKNDYLCKIFVMLPLISPTRKNHSTVQLRRQYFYINHFFMSTMSAQEAVSANATHCKHTYRCYVYVHTYMPATHSLTLRPRMRLHRHVD